VNHVNKAKPPGATGTKQIVIIGGGISGLAAAFFAREQASLRALPAQVILLEEQLRLGGLVQTVYQDDFLIECGPDSFITEKPWALALARRLELDAELVSTREENRRAYVVREGRLVEIPPGFLLLGPARLGPLLRSPALSLVGKFRAGLDLILPRGPICTDESVASFVTRRFGREVFERLVQPLTCAIYGVAPECLSLKATASRFLEMEQNHRSVILGLKTLARTRSAGASEASGARLGLFVSFKRGMATIVERLARALDDTVLVGARAIALAREGSRWRVELSAPAASGTNRAIAADAVVIAAPAYEAARLVRAHAPRAALLLEEITYGCSVLVTLAYRCADVCAPLRGSGFVVPRIEERQISACTFSNLKFPGRAPADYLLARVFMDDGLHAALRTADDAELERVTRRELEDLLGIRAAPSFCHVTHHYRAMPQYAVGHVERIERIERDIEELGSVKLCGAAYRGVGIPDCVLSGETAAGAVLDYLFGNGHPSSGSHSLKSSLSGECHLAEKCDSPYS
jgi:oxygen-dependent protoporphyrinogen oxidase